MAWIEIWLIVRDRQREQGGCVLRAGRSHLGTSVTSWSCLAS